LSAQITYGVKDFDLEFYSDISATILIGSVTGLSAAIAPQTGPIPAQTFAFTRVDGVRSVKLVVHSNHGGAFLALREIAFGFAPDPALQLHGFSHDPATGDAEVSIEGAPHTKIKLVESASLNFASPDRDPIPLASATAGTLDVDGNEVTTDADGHATVQFHLGSAPATFFRAEAP
jgi:hypothetical protein